MLAALFTLFLAEHLAVMLAAHLAAPMRVWSLVEAVPFMTSSSFKQRPGGNSRSGSIVSEALTLLLQAFD